MCGRRGDCGVHRTSSVHLQGHHAPQQPLIQSHTAQNRDPRPKHFSPSPQLLSLSPLTAMAAPPVPQAVEAPRDAPGSSVTGWLRQHGEGVINGATTAFVWGAALHVVYLAAVPEALRVTVAQRNAGVWKRLSLAALLGVAVYEGVATSQLRAASNAAAAEGKRLRAALREL